MIRVLMIAALMLGGCAVQNAAELYEEATDLEQCALADNERECLLAMLAPGDCYDTRLGDAGNVCFPELTQWEAGEAIAATFCAEAPPEQWWCAKEAVFTWCGGGAVLHCTAIVTDGVLLDRCLQGVAPGVLPAGCEALFRSEPS